MYDKITLPLLVNLLADKTGKSKKLCEDFLRELFSMVAETLSNGENVKIRNIGTFKIVEVEARKSVNVNTGEDIEIPGHRKIAFIPAKEMADEVNSPFIMFETVEINDEVSIDNQNTEDPETAVMGNEPAEEEEIQVENLVHHETIEKVPVSEVEPADEIPETIPVSSDTNLPDQEQNMEFESGSTNNNTDAIPDIAESTLTEQTNQDQADEAETEDEDEIEEESELAKPRKKRWNFLWGFLCGLFCTAIVIAVCYIFLADKFNALMGSLQDDPTKGKIEAVVAEPVPVATAEVKNSDSIATLHEQTESDAEPENVAPTAPSDEKVYDTISQTRYLTTMAKAHYGNYNLWPYIYEENKNILGHPDRIRPGTKVVIPPLSKYGVDPNNPEAIKIAKQKGVEIYARFNK